MWSKIDEGAAVILNRIRKNWKKLADWAQRNKIEAFRLYDRDIPEFPFIVDIYKDYALIFDKSDELIDKNKNHLPMLIQALEEGIQFKPDKIVVKKRLRQEGKNQYEKLESKNEFLTVSEGQAKLLINLYDYLDTGLFIDHRPMRQKIFQIIQKQFRITNEPIKLLNLFCYTGSVSVHAALAGAKVTSIDMSATYIEWAKKNFTLNGLDLKDHQFIQENALVFLNGTVNEKFDFIFLDPPTFSNSKRMTESFEVERDQALIVDGSMRFLKKEGVLFFSNNKRSFRIDEIIKKKYKVKDITEESIPMDCHDKKIHQCYQIKHE